MVSVDDQEEIIPEKRLSPSEAFDQWLIGKRPTWPFARDWFWRVLSPEIFPVHLSWIFTLFLAIFAYVAWRESTHSTEALQDQLDVLREDGRPWAYILDIAPREICFGSGANFFMLRATVTISNVGKSPAESSFILGNVVDRDSPDECRHFHEYEPEQKDLKDGSGVIFPGQTLQFRVIFYGRQAKFIDNVYSQKFTILKVCVDYGRGGKRYQTANHYNFILINIDADRAKINNICLPGSKVFMARDEIYGDSAD